MPSERYYLPDSFNSLSFALEGTEFHHLVHVMRNTVGDEIEIVNGCGQLAKAVIHSIEKKKALCRILKIDELPIPKTQVILAQAFPRLSRLELILEKSTELGVSEIWLFPGMLSEKKSSSDHQLERLNHILISAMKQSGRGFLPKLKMIPPIKNWQSLDFPAFFGDISPQAPAFFSVWQQTHPKDKIIFCVGPESGFSDEELSAFKNLGIEGVKLNNNILRTETAAIAAVGLISHFSLTLDV